MTIAAQIAPMMTANVGTTTEYALLSMMPVVMM